MSTELDLNDSSLHLVTLPDDLWLLRFTADVNLPRDLSMDVPVDLACFHSVIRTGEELSIFTGLPVRDSYEGLQAKEGPYRAFRIRGPLDLSLTGWSSSTVVRPEFVTPA